MTGTVTAFPPGGTLGVDVVITLASADGKKAGIMIIMEFDCVLQYNRQACSSNTRS